MAIQRKHPFIEKVIRFFYWPKTAIVGNEFIYETHDNVLNTESYEAAKVPSSSSLIVKFLAAFLYPFFNPVAAIISFFRGVANPELVKKISEDKKRSTEFKKAIKNAHEENMKKFTGEEALAAFDKSEEQLSNSWDDLTKKIDQESKWAEHGEELDELIKQASNSFSLLLVAMSKIIEEEKKTIKEIKDNKNRRITRPLDSLEGVACRIVTQPQCMPEPFDAKKEFAFRIDSTLFAMYHFCRAGAHFLEGKEGRMYTELPKVYDKDGKYIEQNDKRLHANAEAFYVRGTREYSWRQICNTNTKLFYNLFGGEKFKSALKGADERFIKQIDTSKDEVTYKPL